MPEGHDGLEAGALAFPSRLNADVLLAAARLSGSGRAGTRNAEIGELALKAEQEKCEGLMQRTAEGNL